MFSHAKILIVDDQPDNILLLRAMLQTAGYSQIESVSHAPSVMETIQRNEPDIILLDLMMPEMDGFEVLLQLRQLLPPDTYLPVLLMTADERKETREKGLALGVHDFLVRPFEVFDVVLRMRNLLHIRFLHLELQFRNKNLEDAILQRTAELEKAQYELKQAQIEVVDRLGRCGEYRDEETGLHTHRVARHCRILAQKLGLAPDHVEMLRRAAPLHDVGKIGISDTILLKPARLTPEEFETMKTHTSIGASLLQGGHSDLLKTAALVAVSHHERWDGTGYPLKHQGEEIPIEGRILTVADVFDALTHERPYKAAWPIEEAVEEILNQREKQFDPAVVDVFRELDHMSLI